MKAKLERYQMKLCKNEDESEYYQCDPVIIHTECKVKFFRNFCPCGKAVRIYVGSSCWRITDENGIEFYACKECGKWLDSHLKSCLEKDKKNEDCKSGN